MPHHHCHRKSDGLLCGSIELERTAGHHFPGFGWHTFRRQNITLIQEEGATPFEAQAQAGHSKPMMTSAYTLVGMDRRETAVRTVQLRLLKEDRLSSSNAGIVRDFKVVE